MQFHERELGINKLPEKAGPLVRLAPRVGFTTLPVPEAFNWDEAWKDLKLPSAYGVFFRSTRLPDADIEELTRFDDLAHEDAAGQPGFIEYFKGPIVEGNLDNLSFCLWEDRDAARNASSRDQHTAASSIAGKMYSSFRLEKFDIVYNKFEKVIFTPVIATISGSHN